MQTNPRCKCNCHDADFRETYGVIEHQDCEECKRELDREAALIDDDCIVNVE